MKMLKLKFIVEGQINNIPALVQITAWHLLPGNKPLSELKMAWFSDAYMHHSATMS